MGIVSWYNEKIKKMDIWDIGCVKLAVAAIVLLIAKYWAPLLSLEWYWYVLVFVLASLRPLKKVFGK